MIGTLFGGGWLMWGLSAAKEFTLPIGVLVCAAEAFLIACAVYFIRRGRSLRKKYPALDPSTARKMNRRFSIILIAEFVGIGFVSFSSFALHRPDLTADWIAIVVGLHFLPLGKLFHNPVYFAAGIAIVLWCLLSWLLFRGNVLTAWAAIGTGTVLWATSVHGFLRARQCAHGIA
ncbi:MAG: DUF7010 family protein [Candidatus Acidiferrales bacterium]